MQTRTETGRSMNEILFIQISREDFCRLLEDAVAAALSKAEPVKAQEEYLTRAEVAQLFQVTLTAINKWSRQGKLNRHYLGSKVFFLRSEIDALFKAPTKFIKSNDGLQVISRKNKC